MGHEVSDRYYKLGSSVDITCQVALSFLNTIPSPTTTNSNDRFPLSLTTVSTTRIPTTTIFPFIDINLIKKSIEQQQIPYSGKHKIKWKKDGKELPKDIKINLRLVWLSLLFCYSDHVLLKGGRVIYFIRDDKTVCIVKLLLHKISECTLLSFLKSFSVEFLLSLLKLFVKHSKSFLNFKFLIIFIVKPFEAFLKLLKLF